MTEKKRPRAIQLEDAQLDQAQGAGREDLYYKIELKEGSSDPDKPVIVGKIPNPAG